MAQQSNSTQQTDARLLQLSPRDNICVATGPIARGERLMFQGRPFEALDDIPLGHKIAVSPVAEAEKVFKHGASIGAASCSIAPGTHVHTHNLQSDYTPTYTYEQSFTSDSPTPPPEGKHS